MLLRQPVPEPVTGEERRAGMSDDLPHYHGHRDRLRARFMEVGGDAVPDYELLELVLFRSIPRRDVKQIAKVLLRRFGSFAEVLAGLVYTSPSPRDAHEARMPASGRERGGRGRGGWRCWVCR